MVDYGDGIVVHQFDTAEEAVAYLPNFSSPSVAVLYLPDISVEGV